MSESESESQSEPQSESGSPTPPPPTHPVDLGSPRREPLRLPVWVVVALIIILFSSCSAASEASDAASSAREAASLSGTTYNGSTTADEMTAICRLLGAVAAEQGLEVEKIFADGAASGTQCQQQAQTAAQP